MIEYKEVCSLQRQFGEIVIMSPVFRCRALRGGGTISLELTDSGNEHGLVNIPFQSKVQTPFLTNSHAGFTSNELLLLCYTLLECFFSSNSHVTNYFFIRTVATCHG